MPIAINGSGTITGLSVGGLPDGIVDTDMLAANAVATAKIADNAVTSAKSAITTGKILQVQSHLIATQASTTSGDEQDTGSTVNITPSSTSSKILIFVSGNARTDRTGAGDTIGYYRIWKTVGGSSSAVRGSYFSANSVTHTTGAWNYMHVDSPNTTSEITYFVKMKVVNTTTVYWSYAAEASTITVMEIAA